MATHPARREVMDFVEGSPLNRLPAEMEKRGIKPGSPESTIAGRRILEQLTEAFGRMMLGAGFIHGDRGDAGPRADRVGGDEGRQVLVLDPRRVRLQAGIVLSQLAVARRARGTQKGPLGEWDEVNTKRRPRGLLKLRTLRR